MGYSPRSHKQSNTTEQLGTHGAESSFVQKLAPPSGPALVPLDRLFRAQASPPDSCGKGEDLTCPPELRTCPQRPPATWCLWGRAGPAGCRGQRSPPGALDPPGEAETKEA